MNFDLDMESIVPLTVLLVTACVLALVLASVANINLDVSMTTTAESLAYTNWSDDFSADTSADYAANGTVQWDTTNDVLNLTGQSSGVTIDGGSFSYGVYQANISFISATDSADAILVVAKS